MHQAGASCGDEALSSLLNAAPRLPCLQDQNTDAADVDAEDLEVACDGSDAELDGAAGGGGDALGPRAQARRLALRLLRGLPASGLQRWPHTALCACAALRPTYLQIINTACWQSSKECSLLLGALVRALPVGGAPPAQPAQQRCRGAHACRRHPQLVHLPALHPAAP